MADVTARLIWYRLNESSEHLHILWDAISFIVDAGGTVLNYIFLFWLIFGILTIVIVSVLQHHDASRHPKSPNIHQATTEFVCSECRGQQNNRKQMISVSTSDSCMDGISAPPHLDWHNIVLEWLSNSDTAWRTPVLESLLTVMTEESRKLGGDLFVTFEAFLPVGDAPLLNVNKVLPDSAESNKLVLEGDIQLSGLQLSLTVSDNSVSIHSNLLLIIHLIKSQLVIELENKTDVISLVVKSGEITTSDIQFSPYHQGVDYVTDERKLTHHVSAIFTQISLPLSLSLKTGDGLVPPLHKALTPTDSVGSSRPPKPPRSMEDKRLMIKLIKATKLNRRNIGILTDENLIVKVLNARGLHAWKMFVTMDAFCVVEVDNPYQTHSTSVVENTVNPYWDEHFLFDLGIYTKLVTFRVYGSSQKPDGKQSCLGECHLELEKLRANHGVRMVLPLESRPDMSDPVSGSVTIEAFFVDAAEFQPTSAPEVDDVFAQSVEPLMSDAEVDSPHSERMSLNGDSRLSSLSLTGSTSKVIKTSTYTQKDRLSHGSQSIGSTAGVEKAETVRNIINDSGATTESVQEPPPSGVDLSNAEIITVYPNQSVADVVVRELKDRAKRSKEPGGHMTSTIIITAASKIPHVEQPLISLASLESLSDDSSGGTPSINWDVSHQQQQFQHQQSYTPPPQSPQPTIELIVPKSVEPPPPPPSAERKSRLSGLKKRFTRTKDKKPRSHSIERSSGIDEHRYLDPSLDVNLDTSKSDATLAPSSKKKFGGSLRKLFRMGSRSSSSSRQKDLSADSERLHDGYGNYDRRLSVEGSRPDHHGSRSSMERSMTPPHHRTLSPSNSYGYRSPSSSSDAPRRSETVNIGATIDVDTGLKPSFNDGRHYSLPSVNRQAHS